MAIRHLAWPLTLTGTGGFSTLEQDSVEDLASCVAIVLVTPVGSRVEAPDFGTARAEFGVPDAGAIRAAVLEWEPRVDLDLDVIAGLGDLGELTQVKAAVTPHV